MGAIDMRLDGQRIHGWLPLSDALLTDQSKRPGIYFLAHFKRTPRVFNAVSPRIFYIGETCGQSLRQRWRQFKTSAFRNESGHSGGFTYFANFRKRDRERIFVAFATPDEENLLRAYKIRYLERKWLLRYLEANGCPPACNSK
jgi:hypothetical protein